VRQGGLDSPAEDSPTMNVKKRRYPIQHDRPNQAETMKLFFVTA